MEEAHHTNTISFLHMEWTKSVCKKDWRSRKCGTQAT
jgi:hypothetical protein